MDVKCIIEISAIIITGISVIFLILGYLSNVAQFKRENYIKDFHFLFSEITKVAEYICHRIPRGKEAEDLLFDFLTGQFHNYTIMIDRTEYDKMRIAHLTLTKKKVLLYILLINDISKIAKTIDKMRNIKLNHLHLEDGGMAMRL